MKNASPKTAITTPSLVSFFSIGTSPFRSYCSLCSEPYWLMPTLASGAVAQYGRMARSRGPFGARSGHSARVVRLRGGSVHHHADAGLHPRVRRARVIEVTRL